MEIARAVAERLRDQAALRSFLESQPDTVARVTAAGHTTDTALAVKVAKSDPDATVVRMAVSKIEDQALLLQLARSDAPPVARAAAVAQLTDRAVLRELERSSPHPEVRGAVQAKLLDDPAEAGRYAKSENPAVRRIVARVATDQQLLKELAKDPDPFVRQEAIGRMTDRAALSELARAAPQHCSRLSAESRLRQLNRVPTRFELVRGNAQQAAAGTSLRPFVVKVSVSDGLYSSPLPGAKVSFRLASGAGTLSASEALTDEDGTASTTLTLSSTPGPVRVWAAINGLFPRMFSATVLSK